MIVEVTGCQYRFAADYDRLPLSSGAASSSFTIDWRQKGAVVPVENQGQCGSEALFSALGALEAAVVIQKGGPLYNLSEQQLIDCYYCGCGGICSPEAAMRQVIQGGGVTSESAYPYTAREATCKNRDSHIATAKSMLRSPVADEMRWPDCCATRGRFPWC